MGFTDDRRFLWAGGLSDSKIYVFDIATDPAKPTLARTIADLGERTGYLGPHTYYALPGRMLVQALSNTKDKSGVTGMAVYNNKGEFITSYAMPTEGGGDAPSLAALVVHRTRGGNGARHRTAPFSRPGIFSRKDVLSVCESSVRNMVDVPLPEPVSRKKPSATRSWEKLSEAAARPEQRDGG